MTTAQKKKAGTFSLNKQEPIHSWYSYIEGYSSCLVQNELQVLQRKGETIRTIYDPFGGTGTTPLAAVQKGIAAYYSESNPFMQFVIHTKTNGINAWHEKFHLNDLLEYIGITANLTASHHVGWDGFEKFFENAQLDMILSIKERILAETNIHLRHILMLALSSILVPSSKMVRRGDLRYATDKEYKSADVRILYICKLQKYISDLLTLDTSQWAECTKVSEDARQNNYKDTFDCVITSPPYLNGTNYIRNTKLELKLNDMVQTEKDLSALHTKGIIAGINNVSKRNGIKPVLASVAPYIEQLEDHAYDERIPKMVAGYFYDMNDVIKVLQRSMTLHGHFIMDIGDSQFGGIHIPTHAILCELCAANGFTKYGEEILRERRSKNGMALTQRILRFRLEKK